MENEKTDWKGTAAMIFCLLAGAAALWLTAAYLLPSLLPFIIAFVIAASVRPLALRISSRTRLSARGASVLLVLLLLLLVTLALSFGIRRLITELGELARGLNAPGSPLEKMAAGVRGLADSAGDRIARFLRRGDGDEARKVARTVDDMLSSLLSNALSRLGAELPGIITAIVSALPRLILGLAVTVIASFYFALDGARIAARAQELMPEWLRRRVPHIRRDAARTATKYLRAYSLIMLLTFAELFFGLSVIGVEYAFIIAFVTALLDVLPVIGVGTVLIPWAIISFALSDPKRGAGLLILYGVVMAVRQFTEPRIVGTSLGIHPLLTLLAMYLGFRLFGFAGMLLGPIAVTAARTVMPQRNAQKN